MTSPVSAGRRAGTAAARARARRDPAVSLPPAPPAVDRDLENLRVQVAGVTYGIGPRLLKTGCEIELTMDGASQLRLAAQDRDGKLAAILEDEAQRLQGGVRCSVDGIDYVLTAVSAGDDGDLALTFEDEVAWRLGLFNRYVAKRRSKMTRAEFVAFLCDEAGAPPRTPLSRYIPELTDRQPVLGGGKS